MSNSTGRVESISEGDLTVTPTYTPYGEIDTYTYEVDSSEYTWDLTVDIGGRIEGKAETLGLAASHHGYDYDEIGQLTEVVDHLDSDAVVESYDYDANGNRIASTVDYGTPVTRSYAYNADDQLTAINDDEIEYDYDLDGFLTERRRDTGGVAEVHESNSGRVLRPVPGVIRHEAAMGMGGLFTGTVLVRGMLWGSSPASDLPKLRQAGVVVCRWTVPFPLGWGGGIPARLLIPAFWLVGRLKSPRYFGITCAIGQKKGRILVHLGMLSVSRV